MGFYQGSFFNYTNSTPAAVALVDAVGDPLVSLIPAPTAATLSTVTSSVTSVVLLPANVARRKFLIFNDSSKTLHVALAATATMTGFSLLIPARSSYESQLGDYTGVISGVWNSVNGSARITEVTG